MFMITAQDWLQGGSFLALQGHQIFYRSFGHRSKPVLLLIHGFPTSSWDWHKMISGLSERFYVLAPDMLGFGFSDKPVKPYSILEQADLLEALLYSKGITDFHILAHDYGDTVAQELLARYHERSASGLSEYCIRSVCFLNGGLFPETHLARPIQKFLLSPLGFLAVFFMGKSAFKRSFTAVFGQNTIPDEDELNQFWSIIQYHNGHRIFHRLIHYMNDRIIYRSRWVGALQKGGVPLRVINGVVDPVSGIHMTLRYRELVPDPDIVLLEGIGHYPNTEAPEEVLYHYIAFLSSKLNT